MEPKLESEKSKFKVLGDMYGGSSARYLAFRPQYPDEFYEFLYEHLGQKRDLALDVGCGNGQATFKLSLWFSKIIGIDPSVNQIKNAIQAHNIEYRNLPAEDTGLDSNSFDLITVAQAIHWFNLPFFFEESKRILKKDGVLAFWTYKDFRITNNQECENINKILYEETFYKYFAPERQLVVDGYKDIIPPFENIIRKTFRHTIKISIGQLLGIYSTSSGYQKYVLHNSDPLPQIQQRFLQNYNTTNLNDQVIQGYWDISIVICKN
ncbi:hypothetical protein CYY_001722 [Polysphondylium violaceum]|uniref:Methyltransferase type 11 domain-containing protein n=1 Tax=Polysphondylium violaceum TaxID=133409 RepID=A0A8J4Q8U0_9MYCE|nr:hypothetical protein CYY_001722 [Polysphondylium violaceum]